jgi:Pyridoxamine 5'-phosphate oxidase
MEQRPFYHEGMRRLQDRFDGRRVADTLGQTRTHYAFWPDEIEMIRSARFFFIATAWQDYVDCSVKAGDPGFVKIQGPATLEYPEYDGNSMYRTLGNIAQSPNVGLLFVSFDGKSRRIRVNGKAYIHDDAEALKRHYGAKLVIRIECEIFPNCPRYLPNMADDLPSADPPREGLPTPPPPEWKRRDMIRTILPEHDPHIGIVNAPGALK